MNIKKNFSFIFYFLLFLIFISCSYNVFESTLFRTTQDPFYDVPEVDSFTKEGKSFITWQKDDACDLFYLYRAEDNSSLYFECVYSGVKNSYNDIYAEISDNKRYVYRLDKKRGQKIFKGNEYGYGICATIRRDKYENNNIEEKATFLEYDLNCNIPCVKYVTNEKLNLDKDWFYVIVPPMRSAEIVINQNGIDEQQETDLLFQEKEKQSEVINQGVGILATNSTYETKTIFFCISPNITGDFFSNESYSKIIEYQVVINKIIKYETKIN